MGHHKVTIWRGALYEFKHPVRPSVWSTWPYWLYIFIHYCEFTRACLLIYSTEHSPSWEANRFSASL